VIILPIIFQLFHGVLIEIIKINSFLFVLNIFDIIHPILFLRTNTMRKLLVLIFILFILSLSLTFNAKADTHQDPFTNNFLCLPGTYNNLQTSCSTLGPSSYLTLQGSSGISFPIEPVPTKRPSYSLNYVNYKYGKVRTPNAPVYSSIEDALKARKNKAIHRIDSDFSYISYLQEEYINGKRLYMIDPGEWMTANDIIRVSVPVFQGLLFSSTPPRPFGWVLTYLSPTPFVETKKTPGYKIDDYTGHYLKNHEIVWVYDETELNGEEWYLIAPDEWVPHYVVARVIPNNTPPKGVISDRWIEVNLYEQTLSVYDKYQLVFATIIASGVEPFWTRPGLFTINEKLESTPMSGSFEADRSNAYYLEDVPWTMYFDGARALHGAYWRANLGFPQSHGCVNMSVADAHWLFDWANIGDYVYVWDPSGRTPVDEDYYTNGGA